VLDGRDGGRLGWFLVRDELGELFLKQFVLGLEAGDEAEDSLQYLPQAQAAVHCRGLAQLLNGVVLLGLVEHLLVHDLKYAVPLAGFNGLSYLLVIAHGVLELIEEHPVNLHPGDADGLFLHRADDIGAEVVEDADERCAVTLTGLACFCRLPRLGQFDDLVVVILFLEVLAVGKEVEQLEGGLLGLLDPGLDLVVEELFKEVVLARAAPLYLDEVGGREYRAEQAEVQDVGAVVTGCHHADRDADPGLTGLVAGYEVGRAEQVVVGEVDGELLGIGYLRGDLHGEV